MKNYVKAEEDKKKAIATCKQAHTRAARAGKQVTLFKEQKESVMSARREANVVKKEADDMCHQLARSEKR